MCVLSTMPLPPPEHAHAMVSPGIFCWPVPFPSPSSLHPSSMCGPICIARVGVLLKLWVPFVSAWAQHHGGR